MISVRLGAWPQCWLLNYGRVRPVSTHVRRSSLLAKGLVRALILRSSSANFSPRLISPAADLNRRNSMRLWRSYRRWRPANFASLKRGEVGRIGIKFFGKLPKSKIFRERIKKTWLPSATNFCASRSNFMLLGHHGQPELVL